jgi:hypothetical protein
MFRIGLTQHIVEVDSPEKREDDTGEAMGSIK